MSRIYISGAVTSNANANEEFAVAEKELQLLGYTDIVNPMKLPHKHDKSWQSYMREFISELVKCDYIYMLPSWVMSPGAKIEMNLAHELGIKMLFFNTKPHEKVRDVIA